MEGVPKKEEKRENSDEVVGRDLTPEEQEALRQAIEKIKGENQ